MSDAPLTINANGVAYFNHLKNVIFTYDRVKLPNWKVPLSGSHQVTVSRGADAKDLPYNRVLEVMSKVYINLEAKPITSMLEAFEPFQNRVTRAMRYPDGWFKRESETDELWLAAMSFAAATTGTSRKFTKASLFVPSDKPIFTDIATIGDEHIYAFNWHPETLVDASGALRPDATSPYGYVVVSSSNPQAASVVEYDAIPITEVRNSRWYHTFGSTVCAYIAQLFLHIQNLHAHNDGSAVHQTTPGATTDATSAPVRGNITMVKPVGNTYPESYGIPSMILDQTAKSYPESTHYKTAPVQGNSVTTYRPPPNSNTNDPLTSSSSAITPRKSDDPWKPWRITSGVLLGVAGFAFLAVMIGLLVWQFRAHHVAERVATAIRNRKRS